MANPNDDTETVLDAPAASHLLSRAAFGHTPREIERFAGLTRDAAAEALLVDASWAPLPRPPAWVREPWLNTQRAWADTPQDEVARNHGMTTQRYALEIEDLRAWWLAEMIGTPGPLRETMTLFWHGHFTSAFEKVRISQSFYRQNAMFRRHALGNFRELLADVLTDSAMMLYLDMADNDPEHYNENLARELCELFTLGVGHYSENDVREIARALTGWTLDAAPELVKPSRPEKPGRDRALRRDGLEAKFVPEQHDGGVKTILGRTGNFGLHDVADILVAQSATAEFIAGKLIAFFGVSDPERALAERLAAVFRDHADSPIQIASVVRVLLSSPELYAGASRANQVKSPVRLLVGAARQLELDIEPTPNLARYVDVLGQTLFEPPNVQGWPGGRAWLNAGMMAARFHLGTVLLDGRKPDGLASLAPPRGYVQSRDAAAAAERMASDGTREAAREEWRESFGIRSALSIDVLFPAGVPNDAEAIVAVLAARLLIRPLAADARAALIEAVRAVPAEQSVLAAARLLLASSEYQMA